MNFGPTIAMQVSTVLELLVEATIRQRDEKPTVRPELGSRSLVSGSAPELASLLFQSFAVGHRFEFHANSVGDRHDGAGLECESRQHGTSTAPALHGQMRRNPSRKELVL